MSYMAPMSAPPSPLAERVWIALNAMPRDAAGARPTDATVERAGGLSKGLLYKLVNGKQRRVEGENLSKLAKALGVSMAWLQDGEGPAPKPTGLVDAPPWLTGVDALDDIQIAAAFLRRSGRNISPEAERRVRSAQTPTGNAADLAERLIETQAEIDKLAIRAPVRTIELVPRAELRTFPEFVEHFGPGVGLTANEIAEVSRDAAATGWVGLTPEAARHYLLERRDGMRAKPKVRRAFDDAPDGGKSERQRIRDEEELRGRVAAIVTKLPKTKRPSDGAADAFIISHAGEALSDAELLAAFSEFTAASKTRAKG